MGRTKQGGSILGYVIIGGVLLLLLLAGAYALRNYWSGKPSQVAQSPKSGTSSQQPQANDNSKDQSNSSSNTSTQPSQQPPATTTPSTPAPTTTQLPQTGPADTLLGLAILAIIMTTAGVYLHSRRLDLSL